MTSTGRPLRKDAQRNRERLLATAADLFAVRGLDVPFEEIARQAGVSIGTLYNHFPTREALLDAILPDRIRVLEAISEQALAHPDPWAGFVLYVERIVHLQAEDRGLNQALSQRFPDAEALTAACGDGLARVGRVISRAQRHGALRKDFRTQDLICLIWATSRIIEATGQVAPDTWRRCLGFLLDGLRAEAAHRIDVPAMTDDQVAEAMLALARPGAVVRGR
jgi:AcrR family transcriptional regulator